MSGTPTNPEPTCALDAALAALHEWWVVMADAGHDPTDPHIDALRMDLVDAYEAFAFPDVAAAGRVAEHPKPAATESSAQPPSTIEATNTVPSTSMVAGRAAGGSPIPVTPPAARDDYPYMVKSPMTGARQYEAMCDEIDRLRGRVAARDTLTPDQARLTLVQELHEAVYGASWARPEPPAEVWKHLLDIVRSGRCTACVRGDSAAAARDTLIQAACAWADNGTSSDVVELAALRAAVGVYRTNQTPEGTGKD